MDPLNIAKFEVRRFIHSWDNRGYTKNLGSPCIRPSSIFSQIFNRLLFGWTLWTYLPNLKFVALRAPEIIGGTRFGKSLDTRTFFFLPNFKRLSVWLRRMKKLDGRNAGEKHRGTIWLSHVNAQIKTFGEWESRGLVPRKWPLKRFVCLKWITP